MRRRHFLALPLWSLPGSLVTATAAQSPQAAAPAKLQRGVALGLFSEDPLWSYGDLLREIRELGASHVALTVAYYQQHAGSSAIYVHPRFTAPDFAVVRTIREARALGLQVLLFPILRLESPRNDREWRGTLAPEAPDAWWRNYEARILQLARLAARERVEVLSVGSEQSTLDGTAHRPRWQHLIAAVRREFRGLVTYSGNWDHFQDVALYDLVDLAGLCAYFPLAPKGYTPPAEEETLVAAWRKKRAELELFAARVGRPLLLTEVGYLSQRGAAAFPWREGASEPIDLEDQRRCYAAFAEAWRGAAALRGVYFWNYYGWGGRSSPAYTPRRKPAGQEIERYFIDEAHRPSQ